MFLLTSNDPVTTNSFLTNILDFLEYIIIVKIDLGFLYFKSTVFWRRAWFGSNFLPADPAKTKPDQCTLAEAPWKRIATVTSHFIDIQSLQISFPSVAVILCHYDDLGKRDVETKVLTQMQFWTTIFRLKRKHYCSLLCGLLLIYVICIFWIWLGRI